MTTTTTTQYTNDLENKYEIDKLIKKFSYSIKQQEKNTKLENCFKTSLNETTLNPPTYLKKNEQAALLSNKNNNSLKQSQHKEAFEVPNNDKAIFFNTLKSLFAIFDPDGKGSIDLNELNTLGAQKNEILNDVINYLFTNREEELNYNLASNITQLNYNNNNSSNCSNSSRSSSANSNKTKHSFRINNNNNNNNKPLIEENFTTNNHNSTNINNRRETRSPSANQTNKKLKQFNATNKPYYVTFESFAHAAELILDKRKQEKIQMYQQSKRPQSNYNLEQYSTIVTVQPPPPIIASRRPNSLVQSNYTSLPIVNATATNGATLSQAFENVTNKSKLNKTVDQFQPVEFNTALLKNANSLDLGNLLDKEQFLLKQGLNDLDSIRQWFLNQLKDNKLKQQNVHKLKHQNLFTIDKMLTDLKQLNDLNSTFRAFITTNNHGEQDFESLEMDLSTTTNSSSSNSQKENFFMSQQTLAAAAKAADLAIQSPQPLPSYKDYLDQFDLNKSDSDLDSYLKEKQERIDHLQKEKSSLIRRLFEMKSEAASLNTKLPGGNRLNYERVSVTQPQATGSVFMPQKITTTSMTSSNSNDFVYKRNYNQQKDSFT